MTPDLLALSRAYLALPGAPVPISRDTPHHGWRDGIYRDDSGCRWRLIQSRDADTGKWDDGWWVLDLTDAATGGVMLSLLPVGDHERLTPGWLVHAGAGSAPSPGATLAEAAARAAVALGRAS